MVTSSRQAVGLQLCARGSGRSALTELGVGGVGEQRRCAVPAAGCRVQRWRAAVPGSGTRGGGLALLCFALLCRFTGGQTDVTMFPFSFKIEFAAGATIWSGKDYERLSSVFEICAVKCPGSPQKPAQGASVFIY